MFLGLVASAWALSPPAPPAPDIQVRSYNQYLLDGRPAAWSQLKPHLAEFPESRRAMRAAGRQRTLGIVSLGVGAVGVLSGLVMASVQYPYSQTFMLCAPERPDCNRRGWTPWPAVTLLSVGGLGAGLGLMSVRGVHERREEAIRRYQQRP